jgi:hypothetical protein
MLDAGRPKIVDTGHSSGCLNRLRITGGSGKAQCGAALCLHRLVDMRRWASAKFRYCSLRYNGIGAS